MSEQYPLRIPDIPVPDIPTGVFAIDGPAPWRVEYPFGLPGDGFRRLASPEKATCVAYHHGVDPHVLSRLRNGNMYRYGEDDARYIEMVDDMRKHGFKGGNGQRIIVHVNDHDAWIAEGNHRIRAALAADLTSIDLEIRYLGNADENHLLIPFDPADGNIQVISE